MTIKKLREHIFAVGALHPDRELFDELIPLPNGTTYNSYVVKGSDKTALIDAVDPMKIDVLIGNLKDLKIDNIDYLVANHAEQDHSGGIPAILSLYPGAKVVTNVKCKDMLKEHLQVADDRFIVVGDGEKLSLGDKTLEFIIAPWVHWPETMFTYVKEDSVLFTCDFLGSHLASEDLFAVDKPLVYESAKRYYAEIMMPFRTNIVNHLKKIDGIKVDLIAPSHGPVYDDPKFILDAYKDWVSPNVKNEAVVGYVSMHDSIKVAVEHFVLELEKQNVKPLTFNLTNVDLGELAIATVDAATIVIAAPTFLVGPHPKALYAAALIGALRPKTKYFSTITSFGWAGKAAEQLEAMVANLKLEKLPGVSFRGYPKECDLAAVSMLASNISIKHKSN